MCYAACAVIVFVSVGHRDLNVVREQPRASVIAVWGALWDAPLPEEHSSMIKLDIEVEGLFTEARIDRSVPTSFNSTRKPKHTNKYAEAEDGKYLDLLLSGHNTMLSCPQGQLK